MIIIPTSTVCVFQNQKKAEDCHSTCTNKKMCSSVHQCHLPVPCRRQAMVVQVCLSSVTEYQPAKSYIPDNAVCSALDIEQHF